MFDIIEIEKEYLLRNKDINFLEQILVDARQILSGTEEWENIEDIRSLKSMSPKAIAYRRSKIYRFMKQLRMLIEGHKCLKCFDNQNLQLHHLHYRTYFKETLQDIEILCTNCHLPSHAAQNQILANEKHTKGNPMTKLAFKTGNKVLNDSSKRRIREISFIDWSLNQSGIGQSKVDFLHHCKLYNGSVNNDLKLTEEDRGGIISNLCRDGWAKKLKVDGTEGKGKYRTGYTDIQFTQFAYNQIKDPDWAQIRIDHNKELEANCSKISKHAREQKAALAAAKLKEQNSQVSTICCNTPPVKKSIDDIIREKIEQRLDKIVDKMLEKYLT